MVKLTAEGTVEFIEGTAAAERAVWVSAYTVHLMRSAIPRSLDAQYAAAAANMAVLHLREALALASTVEPIT